jgi:uncharacterized LabA/DUF88 family protein
MPLRYNAQMQENNYAFIDSQNVNLGVQALGWRLSHHKFFAYLKEKYAVEKAYLFIGYIASNQSLYDRLSNAGFELIFKPTRMGSDGKIKGNVDSDLVLKAMIEFPHYNKAIIISNDGDFYSLVQYLYNHKKLEIVLSPNKKYCSSLLHGAARGNIHFMNTARQELEHN